MSSHGYDGESLGYLEYDKTQSLYRFTLDGIDQFKNLIGIGCTLEEAADFLVCDIAQLKAAILPGGQLHEVHRHATAIHRVAVRQAQQELSKKYPTMAKHLGHHALKQPVSPAPEVPGLEEKVVGALPDWEANTDDWLAEQSSVKTDRGSTIEALQKMRDNTEDGEQPPASE